MTVGLPDLSRAGLRLDIGVPAPGAATITLDKAERRNAMTPAMWHALAAIGGTLPPEVRVVVLQGAGPSFSAGIDLRLFTPEGVPSEDPLPSPASPDFEDWIESCQAGYSWLRDPAIVSVAAVRGYAIGGGFQLALSCDLRVLADDAQFCMKEPSIGLVPDLTGTKVLTDLVGVPRALELCLTGRMVSAAEAYELRLAELVVPGADLDDAVGDLVAALLTLEPEVARATKELLQQAPRNTLGQQAAAERRIQAELQRSRLAWDARISSTLVASWRPPYASPAVASSSITRWSLRHASNRKP